MNPYSLFNVPFDAERIAAAIRVPYTCPPGAALDALHLPMTHFTVVIHGGAGNMELDLIDDVRDFLRESLVPLAEQRRLLVIDGGTQAGVMRAMGEARAASRATFPLVGVTPHRFALYPGGPAFDPERIPLNPSHSHFVFVEGDEFGVESELLVGMLQGSGRPGVALVINGGQIVFNEVQRQAILGNPIIAVRGSGRIADRLADPHSDECRTLPPDAHLHVADLRQPEAFAALLAEVLGMAQGV